jgi:hypothetical protein
MNHSNSFICSLEDEFSEVLTLFIFRIGKPTGNKPWTKQGIMTYPNSEKHQIKKMLIPWKPDNYSGLYG